MQVALGKVKSLRIGTINNYLRKSTISCSSKSNHRPSRSMFTVDANNEIVRLEENILYLNQTKNKVMLENMNRTGIINSFRAKSQFNTYKLDKTRSQCSMTESQIMRLRKVNKENEQKKIIRKSKNITYCCFTENKSIEAIKKDKSRLISLNETMQQNIFQVDQEITKLLALKKYYEKEMQLMNIKRSHIIEQHENQLVALSDHFKDALLKAEQKKERDLFQEYFKDNLEIFEKLQTYEALIKGLCESYKHKNIRIFIEYLISGIISNRGLRESQGKLQKEINRLDNEINELELVVGLLEQRELVEDLEIREKNKELIGKGKEIMNYQFSFLKLVLFELVAKLKKSLNFGNITDNDHENIKALIGIWTKQIKDEITVMNVSKKSKVVSRFISKSKANSVPLNFPIEENQEFSKKMNNIVAQVKNHYNSKGMYENFESLKSLSVSVITNQ